MVLASFPIVGEGIPAILTEGLLVRFALGLTLDRTAIFY
jgi:hypothetical protein